MYAYVRIKIYKHTQKIKQVDLIKKNFIKEQILITQFAFIYKKIKFNK
jgi:hypothetical protein